MTRLSKSKSICLAFLLSLTAAAGKKEDGFKQSFDVKPQDFRSSGRNDFCILEPHYQSVFEGVEDGKPSRLVVTVLDETKQVDGVETRVVQEYETLGGTVVEISRNYFAVDQKTSDVYYFGEDVDAFEDGKPHGHPGSWLSGKEGAHFGLGMPAKPSVGLKYAQEVAPNVAMDRGEIVSIDTHQSVPAGDFEHCVKVKETSEVEPDSVEYKVYASGVGLVVDDNVKLIKTGFNVEKVPLQR